MLATASGTRCLVPRRPAAVQDSPLLPPAHVLRGGRPYAVDVVMNRRTLFARFAALLVGGFVVRSRRTSQAAPPVLGSGISGLTYKQELEKGLKARRPTDFTFISTVVTKVENGQLPQQVVNETFDYARRQSNQYPFIYFQFAIRKRAQKLGVAL